MFQDGHLLNSTAFLLASIRPPVMCNLLQYSIFFNLFVNRLTTHCCGALFCKTEVHFCPWVCKGYIAFFSRFCSTQRTGLNSLKCLFKVSFLTTVTAFLHPDEEGMCGRKTSIPTPMQFRAGVCCHLVVNLSTVVHVESCDWNVHCREI